MRISTILFFLLITAAQAFSQETDCNDGIDNDNDGLIDCQDPDCPSCETIFSCTAPYTYYMPPMYGSRAGSPYSTSSYGAEDLVLSTLGKAATVQISSPNGTVLQTLTVPVANPVNVPINGSPIPTSQILRPNEDLNKVLSDRGLVITSDQPLQAGYRHLASNNQDILQLQGRASLGRSFYAASQTDLPVNEGSAYERHFVSVMAVEDGTQVSFKIPSTATLPNGNTVNIALSNGSNNTTSSLTLPANRTITVTLNRGQSYMIATMREDHTVTGILVTANKDIVVNSGSQHSPTSQGSDQDGGYQQLVPTPALETRYIAIDGGNTSVRDYIVIVAVENGTTFTVNGTSGGTDGRGRAVPTTLAAGQHFTYYFDDVNYKAYYIAANKRIYVYHAAAYGTSEFGMDLLPPINQCIGSNQLDFERPGTNSLAFVIIPTSGLSSLRFRNQPYTTYAANIDPDGAGPLPAARANTIGTSGYSYVVVQDGNIAATGTNNRVTSDEKFHLGVISRTGGTGNYAFFSNYEKSIEILDPVSLETTNYYIAGQVNPGVAKEHCVILTGCGSNNVVKSAAAEGWNGPGTEGTVTLNGSCVTYTMRTDALPCATETVSLVVENEFGIKSQVCLVFENSARPFTIGTITPSNAFFCSSGLPNTVTLNAPVNVPTGVPTFSWADPAGNPITPTNSVSGADYGTSIVVNQAGTYRLTVTVSACSQTVDVPVSSSNCNDLDGDGIANFVDLDDDNDGIPDRIESGGWDPTADADSDGIPTFRDPTPGAGLPAFVDVNGDGVNDVYDNDLDGIINAFDLDSDNDGIPDVVEALGVDADGNGIIDNFTDTDNDGLSQNVDANNSGASGSGNGLGAIDSDGDGVLNIFDLDSDNDGIPDIVEVGGVDNNNDGMVDSQVDANANGLMDVYDINPGANGTPPTSTGADTNSDGRPDSYPRDNIDGDARPNFLDIDSDGDGIIDFIEAGFPDNDNNGIPDGSLGADGWSDAVDALSSLSLRNTDAATQADYLDIDSDNDGIPDNIEGQSTTGYLAPSGIDADRDGLDDAYDNNNAMFGGAPRNGIQPVNSDGTDTPDYRDADADNDGEPDSVEGWDVNGNGVIDGAEITSGTQDSDGDGLLDNYDIDDTVLNATNGTTPLSYPDVDDPGRDRDWRDALPIANDDLATTNEETPVAISVVSNDQDFDGTIDPATVDLNVSSAGIQNTFINASGSWTVSNLGVVTFTPASGFNGSAVIQYVVNDDEGSTSNMATITVDVNDTPVANDDATSTNEDTSVSLNVVSNDTDANGGIDPATVDLNPGSPGIQNSISNTYGSWSVTSAGVLTFSPAQDYHGAAFVTYTIMDSHGVTSNEATVTITVISVNDAPVAADDNGITDEDVAITFDILANDNDIDGSLNAATVDLNTSSGGIQNTRITPQGTWTSDGAGSVTFSPVTNFFGSATITYTVRDNSGATSNVATITITVAPVNDAPVAANDNATTNEDTPITFNVTGNDTDVDGTINAASVDLDPGTAGIQNTFNNASGSWSVNASGNVTYTPTLNFNGTASTTYRVNDNSGATSNSATISVTVTPVNDAPVAVNDNATTNEDTPVTFNVTANDTDVDGTINAASVDLDPATAGIQTTFSNTSGSWSVNATGNVTYTPTLNFNGPASITYRVNDNSGATSNAATIIVAVSPVNDAPIAVNDNATTSEDTPITFNVTGNDTDVDGTINAASVDLDPGTSGIQNTFNNASGSWSVNASGNVTYTPTLNFNGTASTTYRVNDNSGATSNSATISVTVTPVNDAPVAVNDNATTNEDTPVTFNVTGNDTDVDGTINAASVDLDLATAGIQNTFSNASGGWSVNATGNVTYTPTLNFNGPASITYRVNDNSGATSNAATIIVTVTPVNDAPIAVNDNATTNEDTPITFNVTGNDTDVDGTINAASVDLDPATAGIQTTFSNASGNWSVTAAGNVTYTPTLNFNGSASISYRVNDNSGATSNSATITVTVTPVNDAPVAVNDNATTNEDTPVTFNVTGNDTDVDGTINAASVDLDPATAGIQNTFSNASGGWSVNATGNVTYTPTLNFNGPASITYRVNDNSGATSSAATIIVTVTPVNDAPIAVNDNATTNEDTPITFNVTGNDTDVDGTINAASVDLDPATAGIQTTFSNASGNWSVNAAGNVTYTPALNFNGTASTTYRVNDNSGATSNSATISVTVTPVNDAPVAVNDNATTNEDTPVTFNITSNDTDVDGAINAASVDLDPATAGIQNTFSNASGGWSVNASGNVTYTPTLNFNGPASITYRVNDNSGATSTTATITVTVNPVNDAPVAVNDNATTNEDTPITFSVTGNDTDIDGTINAASVDLDPATAGIQTTFSNASGNWSVNATGNVTYTPTLNFNGTASIAYRVNDNSGATSNSATITVVVTLVNDAPVAVNDNATTNEDTPVTFNVTGNDTDVDGTINASSVDLDPATAGIQGTFMNAFGGWSVNVTGNVTYTPTLNFNGSAWITYRVNDNSGATSNSATIAVTVTPVNDAPIAVNDNGTTSEDAPVTFNVTGNDTDVDGTINVASVDLDPASAGIQTTFSNASGNWSVNAAGNVTYTPTLNFNGSASISYRVNDNSGATSNSATITVTVTPVNDAPVAVNDNATTNEDTPVTFNVTVNDTDVDGTINAASVDLDPATVGIQTTFSNASGSWSVNVTGNVTYTPTLNFNGSASISYRVNDNSGATSNSATITVSVTPVNDAPVAVNDNATTNEDTPATFNVTGNDTDVDGTINAASVDLDPATAGIQTTFSNASGSWSVNATGHVTYTPALNFNGSASITYSVNDNSGATSNAATITVTVTPVNDAPVAVNDNATTSEDTPITFSVTGNDTDVDGTINAASVDLDPATAGIQTSFSNAAGSWSVNATGNVTYTPTLNFNGSASITYHVNDNIGVTSNSATITVTVTPVNDAPVAVDDSATTNEDTPVTFNTTDNDTDVDGTINAASVDLDPATAGTQTTFSNASGSWNVNATGDVTYTPTLNFNGSASITYRVNDNSGATSNAATITVTVTPVNDAPVAVNDNTTTTNEDTPVTFNVTGNDTDVDGTINPASVDLDPATAGIQTTFSNASGIWSVNATGDVTYTPTLNFNGTSSITYRVNDNSGATSNAAIVSVTVAPVNDLPIALADAVTTEEDISVVIDVASNDYDDDGSIDPSTIDLDPDVAGRQQQFTSPAGTWTALTNGTIGFTPSKDYFGSATIRYTIDDDEGGTSNSAALTVEVTPVNDPVRISDDHLVVDEDGTVTNNILANDIDIDGTINAASVDLDLSIPGVQHSYTDDKGTWTIDDLGNLTFNPVPNYNGDVAIRYTVADNSGDVSEPGWVYVVVTDINDAPVAVADNFNGIEDVIMVVDPLVNDIDVDGTLNPQSLDLDPIASGTQKTKATSAGLWSVDNSGILTFVPVENFNGVAVLSYTIVDDDGDVSDISSITISLSPVNDAPVLFDSQITATQAFPVRGMVLTPADADPDGTDLHVNTTPISGPTHGTIIINSDGSFEYVSEDNFVGTDQVVVEVCDSGLPLPFLCATTTITINVVRNQKPVVASKGASMVEDNSFSGNVIGPQDRDPEGLPLAVETSPVTAPQYGRIVISANGDYQYTPVSNFNGTDKVTLRVCDTNPAPECTDIQLVFTVAAVNDRPLVSGETIQVVINKPFEMNILSNDIDPDSTALRVDVSPVATAMHGTVFIDEAGNFVYTPDRNYVGPDQVAFRVCDSGNPLPALCATNTITIDVVDPNFGTVSIPEGFSPNGDGDNDAFAIGYLGAEPIQFEVYNRWGNLIYKSDNYQNDWRGTAMYGVSFGSDVPDGTYFYKVRVGTFEAVKSFTLQR